MLPNWMIAVIGLLLAVLLSCTGVLYVPDYEREALCDLYKSTQGGDWFWRSSSSVPWNCTGDSDPCANDWEGIYCTDQDPLYAHVKDITLEDYNMRGKLPESLGNLTYLTNLELDINSISGSIPFTVGKLLSLVGVDLGQNLLTGTIPSFFANMTGLDYLLLYENRLTGTIPPGIFYLPVLTQFNVESNQLYGIIPTSVTSARRLQLFSMVDNEFSGTIPWALGTMGNLTELALSTNTFTGSIPASLANLTSCQYLGLDANKLTGTIPAVLGYNEVIRTINVSANQLTGTIPTHYPHLQRLLLQNNLLTGTLPETMQSWVYLTQVSVSSNRLVGSIPAGLSALQSLTFFYADNNHLTGTIPSELGQLPLLASLNLSFNSLVGSIPRSFVNISTLQVLLLHQNALTGSLTGLFNATSQFNFSAIQVSNNLLTGQIPAEIFRLPQLAVFAAVSNCFDGTLPVAICNSSTLDTAALDGLQSATSCRSTLLPGISTAYTVQNSISQGIPACLFGMRALRTLHLSGNGLTGSLPDVAISPVLTALSLSHNYLRGHIPSAFQHHNWVSLDLSYNQLAGTLDSDFAAQANTSITLEQNRVSGNIPETLRVVEDVSILGSNLFSCDETRDQLPEHNPDRDTYECGSEAFNASAYAWMALAVMLCAALVLLGSHWKALEQWADRWLVPREQIARWWAQGVSPGPGADQPDKATVLSSYANVCAIYRLLAVVAAVSAAVIVCTLLPVYGALSHYGGTLTHQYAWTVSVAFLSGHSAFATLFVLYVLGPAAFLALFVWLVRPSGGAKVIQAASAEEGAGLPSSSYALICAIFIVFNFSIAGAVNVGYIFAFLNTGQGTLVLVQLVLSLFKLLFNRFCAPAFLRSVAERILSSRRLGKEGAAFRPADFLSVQLVVALVNNIVIPCIVVATVSPGCFVNVFQAAPTVSSTFTYDGTCFEEAQHNSNDDIGDDDAPVVIKCLSFNQVQESTSYNPPFQYSYQCSSSIITYYAPAMLNMCILATFVAPAAQALGKFLHARALPGSRWHGMLGAVVPRVLQPLPPAEDLPPSSVSYFPATLQLISLLSNLGLLLTFGVAFPPLALTFAITIVSSYVHTRLKVGHFLAMAQAEGRMDCAAIIQRECEGVGQGSVLLRAAQLLVLVSFLFYSLFLFDILGDEDGFTGAYWVLIVMALLPLCALGGVQALQYFAQAPPGSEDAGSGPRVDVVAAEVHSSQGDVDQTGAGQSAEQGTPARASNTMVVVATSARSPAPSSHSSLAGEADTYSALHDAL